MTKFLVTYHTPPEIMKDVPEQTPEQMQETAAKWMGWAEKAGAALVDFGTPLGNGKSVSPTGVEDAPGDNFGYSIIEAADFDAVRALLEGHPHLDWDDSCRIQVHEMMPIPGAPE